MSKIDVAVIGAGTMGQGIVQLALQAGHQVVLVDQSSEALDKAKANLAKLFQRFSEKEKITSEQASAWLAALTLSTDNQSVANVGLVIEAIVERLDVKQNVFSALENIVATDTILASNTSSLSVTAIASALQRPEQFVGLHFFNPAGIMPLVEVVKAVQTDETILQQATKLMASWGKTPVRCKDTPSFIVNRVARPYYVESFRLLEENALSPRDLDALLRGGMNFRMGPCELTDFIGHDVNYAVSQSLWSELGYPAHLQPSFVQGDLVAANYLGRKNGRGFYRYDEDATPNTEQQQVQSVAFSEVSNANNNTDIDKETGYIGMLENGVAVFRTDGLRAIDWEMELDQAVALVDIADNSQPDALAISYSPAAKALMGNKVPETANLTQRWVLMPDRPGLVNLRVISLIINEAATAALQGVADEAGIDSALKGGVNYPKGAFQWLDSIGIHAVGLCIEELAAHYGSARYHLSPYLQDEWDTVSLNDLIAQTTEADDE